MSKRKKQARKKPADDFIDIDYWDQLSEDEKVWLKGFIRDHYFGIKNATLTVEENRSNYRRNNYIKRDLWNYHRRAHKLRLNNLASPAEAMENLIDLKKLDESIKGDDSDGAN